MTKSDPLKLSRAVSINETALRVRGLTCSAEAKCLAHLRSVASAHGELQNHRLVRRLL